MRVPRVRFKVRAMMASVAILAVLMGTFVEYGRLSRKSADLRARVEEHAGLEQTLRWTIATSGADAPIDISAGPGIRSKRFSARAGAEWQAALRRKYERAARYPWLSVDADPPEPE
jgi:hypothetical protein